jgi:predicted RNA-binding protein YlxR (DUF448 family)
LIKQKEKMATISVRTCIVCRQKAHRPNFIKITLSKDGCFDINGKGRGANVCKNCITQIKPKKALNRAFKTNVDVKIYDEIETKIYGLNK